MAFIREKAVLPGGKVNNIEDNADIHQGRLKFTELPPTHLKLKSNLALRKITENFCGFIQP